MFNTGLFYFLLLYCLCFERLNVFVVLNTYTNVYFA